MGFLQGWRGGKEGPAFGDIHLVPILDPCSTAWCFDQPVACGRAVVLTRVSHGKTAVSVLNSCSSLDTCRAL